MTPTLDFDDPLIREMVKFHHTPSETYLDDGTLITLECERCHQDWPCSARQGLRHWYK